MSTIPFFISWIIIGAIISKGAGFNFDNTPVKNKETKLNGVFTEYLAPIGSGFSEYDTAFPKALERLKAAGIDKHIAEYQKQFSEWYAGHTLTLFH